jgi:hypothetical protein
MTLVMLFTVISRDFAARGAAGLDGVSIRLLDGADDIRYLDANGAAAFASDNTIYLGPAAFVDEETHVRTLGHERIPVCQRWVRPVGLLSAFRA